MIERIVPPVSELRRRFEERGDRPIARYVRGALVSLAGLVGRPVLNQSGAEIGRLVDVVTRWGDAHPYPPMSGIVVRVGRRRTFVPAAQIARVGHDNVHLISAQIDLRDFEERPGEVALAARVLDHELVDIDGVRVVRASDLYLAAVGDTYRLVAVDVGVHSLVRRIGPARLRSRPTPGHVLDWASVHAFGSPDGSLRLGATRHSLPRLRPGQLADLLEDLGRVERQQMLDAVELDRAADALEEMESRERLSILREAAPERAAALLSEMEPDEAVAVLRELDREERDELLAAMPYDAAATLNALLGYGDQEAGGLMTTTLVIATLSDRVTDIRERLRAVHHQEGVDAVIVVDSDGRVVDDVTLLELFLAEPDTTIEELVGPPWPAVVTAHAHLEDVLDQFAEARHSSLLVADDEGRPIGRILGDDLIDALAPRHRRRSGG
jgi:CBS domain-containing protein